MRKVPETRDEWITYGRKAKANRQRSIPVIELSVKEMKKMWDYQYQAKIYQPNSENLKIKTILASNSLNNLKKEIRNRKIKIAWITTSEGSLSYGQEVVNEYPYCPRY